MDAVSESTEIELLEKLKEDGYVNSDNTVNIDVLIPDNDLKRGRGSIDSGDVYVLEQRADSIASASRVASTSDAGLITSSEKTTASYFLIYYNDKKADTNIGKVLDAEGYVMYEPTSEDYFEYDPETGGIALKDSASYYTNFGLQERNLGLDTIVVPSTYQGQPVTRIGITYNNDSGGKYIMGINAKDVKKIILPNTITEIAGSYYPGAFTGCDNLQEIILPDSLEIIGESAFRNCNSLEAITIPDTVTSIGDYAFDGCTSLKEIVIPENVTSIGMSAFNGCTSLTEVRLPSQITSISPYLFDGCSSLESITIPTNVTKIDMYAFAGCTSLKEIVIPETVTEVSSNAFGKWNSNQTIYVPFKEGEQPSGWNAGTPGYPAWNNECNANIVYAD